MGTTPDCRERSHPLCTLSMPESMTLTECRGWLPDGKRAAVCFSVDDVHPATSRDEFDAGGDLGRGALGHVERLLDRHPRLRVTLFVTPDWRLKRLVPTRKWLTRIPLLRERIHWAPLTPRGHFRVDRFPEFVAYLNALPRTDCALHGLHHAHPRPHRRSSAHSPSSSAGVCSRSRPTSSRPAAASRCSTDSTTRTATTSSGSGGSSRPGTEMPCGGRHSPRWPTDVGRPRTEAPCQPQRAGRRRRRGLSRTLLWSPVARCGAKHPADTPRDGDGPVASTCRGAPARPAAPGGLSLS